MSMRFQEQIYTSAPELLDRSSANLGVVAQTRDFPATVESALSPLRAYTILRDIPLENVEAHPPRLVIGPIDGNEHWYGLSQVVFAGADHTGRTTPLAHHLLFRREELSSPGLGPWSIARAAKDRFRRQWKESPHWIEPPPTLQPISDLKNFQFPQNSWKGALRAVPAPVLFTMAESLLNFSTSQRPVVVCIDRKNAHDAMDYIGDLLALLPESIQLHRVCISHVVDLSDYVHNSALMLTYPGTPFLEQSRGRQDPRAPVIFDLTHPDTLPARNDAQYGAALAKRAKLPQPIFEACREWDRLELESGEGGEFHLILQVRDALKLVTDAKDAEDVAGQLTQVVDRPAVRKRIEDWSLEMLEQRITAGDWGAITFLGFDARWPATIRQAAWRTIQRDPSQTAPHIVAQLQTNPEKSTELWSALQQLNKAHPQLADDSIRQALRTNSPLDAQTALALMQTCFADLPTLVDWTGMVLAGPGEANRLLLPAVKQSIDKSTASEGQLQRLYDAVTSNGHNVDVGREILAPLLRNRLKSGALEPHWDAWTCRLMVHALHVGIAAGELNWLIETFGQRIRPDTTVRQWLQAAFNTPYYAPLFALIRDSSLSAAVESNDDGLQLDLSNKRIVRAAGGPLWPPRILACLLLAAAITQTSLYERVIPLLPEWSQRSFSVGKFSIPGISVIQVIPAIAWFVWELLFRFGPNSMRRTKVVYRVRWSLAIVLGLAVAVTASLYFGKPINSWVDSMKQQPTESKSSSNAK